MRFMLLLGVRKIIDKEIIVIYYINLSISRTLQVSIIIKTRSVISISRYNRTSIFYSNRTFYSKYACLMSRTECSVHDDNANRVHEITAGSIKS